MPSKFGKGMAGNFAEQGSATESLAPNPSSSAICLDKVLTGVNGLGLALGLSGGTLTVELELLLVLPVETDEGPKIESAKTFILC